MARKIVLTGGPGGGKTTAADLFRRELKGEVVVVPEAATLLFSGGFPRSTDSEIVRSTQRAIYHVQKNLEDVQSSRYPDRLLVCDRGTPDGAAYWPTTGDEYYKEMETTREFEFSRYDAVIFFESAAKGALSIESGNPTRNESLEQAIRIDDRMKEVWQEHPEFHFVGHNQSFFQKITIGFNLIKELTTKLTGN